MKIRTQVYKRCYAVALTVAQFVDVLHREDKQKVAENRLCSLLDNAGCLSTYYDGHFGACIFYDVGIERDTPEFRRRVEEAIIMYAARRPINVIKRHLGLEA